MTTTLPKLTHAEENAQGHAEKILALYRGYLAITGDGASDATIDGEIYTDAEEIEDHARECALSVEVRTGWYVPGTITREAPAEYQIVLTCGGPALRIRGRLNETGEPETARLEWQDWGTQWTGYLVIGASSADIDAALMWYVSLFCFEE